MAPLKFSNLLFRSSDRTSSVAEKNVKDSRNIQFHVKTTDAAGDKM